MATLLSPFREIAVDRPVAERAGRIRRETGLRMPDALIAATAVEHRLGLATRNRNDFDRYANDNFGHEELGRWQDDFRSLVQHCLEDGVRGEPLVAELRPAEDDYFILKPRHSAFFATPLEHLLDRLEVDTLIVAGFATDQCVLLTAAEAHMRGYRVVVPGDCSAAETDGRHRRAIEWIGRVAEAAVAPAAELDLDSLG